MNQVDRTKSPANQSVADLQLPVPAMSYLANSIPVYSLKVDTTELVKLELIFEAGAWYQKRPLIATATNAMLQEGSKQFSANDIAEQIEFYGAYLNVGSDKDISYITIFTLEKHLKKIMPIIEDMVKHPQFPENEFQTYIRNLKQGYLIERQKVNYAARQHFQSALFGPAHPYGMHPVPGDFDGLQTDVLIDFYNFHYGPKQCTVILSGKVTDKCLKLLDKHFGDNWPEKPVTNTDVVKIKTTTEQRIYEPREACMQSAIRIGKLLFDRNHPDYLPMQIVSTILGGYFGSRLMSNIREDKGYTYGIGASLVTYRHTGYFFITSQVGADVTAAAIEEIYKEIERLKNEEILSDELDTVKQYMLGAIMRNLDGPFSLSERLKTVLVNGKDLTYFKEFTKIIGSITSADIQLLANKYFNISEFHEIIVGKI
jgi:zinc protease